ncbi:MAG: hypothetical protein A370_01162, partial [Clostridium sp. Maddingley MBC34-26]
MEEITVQQSLGEYSVPSTSINADETLEEETLRLARLIYTQTPHDGTFSQHIPGLHINRYSRIETDIMKTFYLPS